MGCCFTCLGLQTELQAALKESEIFRQKLKLVEEDLQISRQRGTDLFNEITQKTGKYLIIIIIFF